MKTFWLVVSLTLVTAFLLSLTLLKKTEMPAPVNVVMIVADALRWDALGCY